MVAHAIVVLLAFVALTVECRASDVSPATADVARIEALVAQLASDDFDARDAASRELAGAPLQWLPILVRLAQASADPEVKCRAYGIVRNVAGERVVPRMPAWPPFFQRFVPNDSQPDPRPITLLRPRLDPNFPVRGGANPVPIRK